MAKTHISPIDVYRLLPMTNCKACGEENCMAFATKLVNREVKAARDLNTNYFTQ